MPSPLQIKLEGDWKKVGLRLANLSPVLTKLSKASQRAISERLVRIVKGHLSNQDIPGWEQLSDSTVMNKGREDILLDTELYLDSIKAWSQGGVYMAGVPLGITYPRSKNSREVAEIAYLHEFWSISNTGPHRPLWNPSIEELNSKDIKNIIKRNIFAGLIANGYKPQNFSLKNLNFNFSAPNYELEED